MSEPFFPPDSECRATTQRLLTAMFEGDRSAVNDLMQFTAGQLLRYCSTHMGKPGEWRSLDPNDVSNIVLQEVIHPLANGEHPPIDAEKYWRSVFYYANKRCKDGQRKNRADRAHSARESDLNAEESPINVSCYDDKSIEKVDNREFLDVHLERIAKSDPAGYQLMKMHLSGVPKQQIADQLSVSVRTVNRRTQEILRQWQRSERE